jgi:hypothetical protein
MATHPKPESGSATRRAQADDSARVIRALTMCSAVPPPHAEVRTELHDAAREYVGQCTVDGLPPARTSIEIERLIVRSGVPYRHHVRRDFTERLTEQVVRWCLDAYYVGE